MSPDGRHNSRFFRKTIPLKCYNAGCSGVLKYNYEIFWMCKCGDASRSIADLRRFSKSPCCRQSEVFALKREEIPSLTLAFLGPRFRRLTFHQPTLSQASQAIHTQQQRA